MCSMNTRKSIFFFADLRPNSTLQATWIQHASQVSKVKKSNILHNLIYVTLFFVICFSDCFFDAFNGWNHCIL